MDQATKELLERWKEEQYKVAEQVVILNDGDVISQSNGDTTQCTSNYGEKYKVIPIKNRPENQESSTPTNLLLGGVDVSFYPANDSDDNTNDIALAVYVVMRGKKILYQDSMHFQLSIPYVSSFLSYREIEPLQQLVFKQMKDSPELTPSVILVDGNGILHERSAGIASFLGVRVGIPTIGVGKSLYCVDDLTKDGVKMGVFNQLNEVLDSNDSACEESKMKSPNSKDHECLIVSNQGAMESSNIDSIDESLTKGITGLEEIKHDPSRSLEDSMQALSTKCQGFAVPLIGSTGRVWGAALIGHGGKVSSRKERGKQNNFAVGTKVPIYVSIGHSISLHEALRICTSVSWARIPEPVRQADLIGREIIRSMPTNNS